MEDALKVSEDGLVHSGVAQNGYSEFFFFFLVEDVKLGLMGILVSNGAVFMPNTMTMQQINCASSDHFRETLDEKAFAKCVMLRIPKGI